MRIHNKSKGFAFITAPQHVTNELVELNGVQFQGNCLIIEKASPRRNSVARSNPHSRPHVTSNSLENENNRPKINLFLGTSLMQILLNLLKDLLPDIHKTI